MFTGNKKAMNEFHIKGVNHLVCRFYPLTIIEGKSASFISREMHCFII